MKTTLESGLAKIDSAYEQQAQAFLDRFGIKFRATLSDSKPAPWDDKYDHERHHFRICLSRSAPGVRLVFDFWDSKSHSDQGLLTVTPYDVLACISGDTHCPDTFKDWCGEFGENEDSIKALQTYRRCLAFAKRLQAFFTTEEITALQEIQ